MSTRDVGVQLICITAFECNPEEQSTMGNDEADSENEEGESISCKLVTFLIIVFVVILQSFA